MMWQWCVRYRKGTKMREKFGTEAESRAFFAKCKKYDDGAVLFRFKKESFWDQLKAAKVYWRGFEWELTCAASGVGLATLMITGVVFAYKNLGTLK